MSFDPNVDFVYHMDREDMIDDLIYLSKKQYIVPTRILNIMSGYSPNGFNTSISDKDIQDLLHNLNPHDRANFQLQHAPILAKIINKKE